MQLKRIFFVFGVVCISALVVGRADAFSEQYQTFKCDDTHTRLIPPGVQVKKLMGMQTSASHYARVMDPATGDAFDPSGSGTSISWCLLGVRSENTTGFMGRLLSGCTDNAGNAYSTATEPGCSKFEFQDVDTANSVTNPPGSSYNFASTLTPVVHCSNFYITENAKIYMYAPSDTGQYSVYGYPAAASGLSGASGASAACPY